MSFLSNLIKKAAPVVATVAAGTPIGTAARVVTVAQEQQERKYQKKLAIDRQAAKEKQMSEIFGSGSYGLGRVQSPMTGSRVQTNNAGFGSSFGSFLGDIGSNIVGPFSALFSQVRPFISQQSTGQPALPTRTNFGGQESQSSGVTEGFVGGIPNVLGQAAKFLRTPQGQIGTGLLTGIGGSMLAGGNGGMRITRKMKSQYRAVLNLAQGDYDQAASMIGVSTDQFIMVLLKRFRNDGPVVTKAALRKTKTTVRRLKSMCDMYDSLRPTATRRKSPMRRASTTLISNKQEKIMPLVKKRLSIAAGATSDQVLTGTTYEYVDPGTRIVVAAAVDTVGSATADTTMDFNVNNAEFSKNASVSALVTGEPFGWNGNYAMNDMVTTGQVRNRPVITFTNGTAATRTVDVAVFIGG